MELGQRPIGRLGFKAPPTGLISHPVSPRYANLFDGVLSIKIDAEGRTGGQYMKVSGAGDHKLYRYGDRR